MRNDIPDFRFAVGASLTTAVSSDKPPDDTHSTIDNPSQIHQGVLKIRRKGYSFRLTGVRFGFQSSDLAGITNVVGDSRAHGFPRPFTFFAKCRSCERNSSQCSAAAGTPARRSLGKKQKQRRSG
ncbi:hypothetical protein Dimus_024123 [Dionaea muscipula]